MGIRRTEGSFEGEDGTHLFRRSWQPDAPERVVLLVHGFAEHSGRYEHVGSWLAERGSAVHAYDHRGHGRSAGPRNFVRRFDDFLDDLAVLLEIVKAEHPDLPVTLIGHSMGGLVSVAFVRERQPAIGSLVTSGPALVLGPAMRGPRAWLLRVLAAVLPKIRIEAGLPPEGLSRDPEVVRRYQADPLIDTRITPRLAAEMMRAVERNAAGGAEIRVPALLLHGGSDPLCASSGSEALFRSLPEGAAPPSALHVYPGLLHEIFNEPEHEEIFAEILGWMRTAASVDPGAASGVR